MIRQAVGFHALDAKFYFCLRVIVYSQYARSMNATLDRALAQYKVT
jgi:hypothetical protein